MQPLCHQPCSVRIRSRIRLYVGASQNNPQTNDQEQNYNCTGMCAYEELCCMFSGAGSISNVVHSRGSARRTYIINYSSVMVATTMRRPLCHSNVVFLHYPTLNIRHGLRQCADGVGGGLC